MNLTFAHLLNLITKSENPGLYAAQSITLQTLKLALNDAETACLDIQPLFVHDIMDPPIPDHDYAKFVPISQSVLDYGMFTHPRKLPLIRHLFEAVYAHSSADYIIFTNIDLGLLPYFYKLVSDIVQSGVRSFTVTRRTLDRQTSTNTPVASLFADIGEPHRGWDCFIFPREFIPGMHLGNLCMGAPLAGLGILANLIAKDRDFLEFKNLHLTFHVGNDRFWNKPINQEYAAHNQTELSTCLKTLEGLYGEFPKGSPPHKYLRLHRIPLIGSIYDRLNVRFHIPVRYFRRK